jgi:hypothetical protein
VRAVCRADATLELQLDILACLTEPQANAKEYISRVEGCTAKIDESMEK